MKRRLLATAVLAALAVLAVARPADAQRPAAGAAKREKVKQKVRAMRAWIVTEELELDEATAGKLVPVLAKFDDEMARLLDERNQLRRALQAAQDTGDEPKLDGLIDKLVANQQARWASEQRRFTDLRKLLTARQTARLIDVLPDLDRRILQGLRGAGRRGALDDDGAAPPARQRPRRPRAPGTPRRPGPDDSLKYPFRDVE